LFPTTTARESLDLLAALPRRHNLQFAEDETRELESCMLRLLTPGAAEALAVKIYRLARTTGRSPFDVLRESAPLGLR
jgi:hypothetical protein